MKMNDLNEMTMRVGSYEDLGKFLHTFKSYKHEQHVGDIEQFDVYKKDESPIIKYAVFDDGEPIAFFIFDHYLNELNTSFVHSKYRKKGLFSAFLFFLKRNEGHSRIVFSELHSEDTVEAIKRIYKRFDAFWDNGDEKVPYSPNTIDKFYSQRKLTGWKLVLENDGDFSSFPKFFNETFAKAYYFNLLHDEE